MAVASNFESASERKTAEAKGVEKETPNNGNPHSGPSKEERDRVLEAVKKDWSQFYFAPEELRNDRDIALAAMQQNVRALSYASEELRNDRDLILTAVQQSGQALSYASEKLKNDRKIVMTAVKQDGEALEGASKRLKNDRDIVLAAAQKNGRALRYASKKLRDDRDIALTAIQQDATQIVSLSEELKNDRDIVMTAVKQNGQAIQYVSDDLRNDRGIVLAAVRQNWRAFNHASEELKKDKYPRRVARQEKKKQSSAETQALNFLWLNLDLPAKPDPEDGSIRVPLPEEYIENVREAGRRHPRADINVWFDSRRLTKMQWDYLEVAVEDGLPNVHVKDLCSIPEYKNEELYSRTETKKNWRSGYGGVVWLQVDAAKILISLQGDYDQRFFADMDHAHLDIESGKVQKMLNEHGLLIGSWSADSNSGIENQLWGFDRSRLKFFQEYYATGLRESYQGEIAYGALHPKVNELDDFEHISEEEICFPIGSIGLAHAEQPGHEWSNYKGRSEISRDELTAVFKERSPRNQSVAAENVSTPVTSTAKPFSFQ